MQGCLLSRNIRGLYAGEACMKKHPAKHNGFPCVKDVGHLLQNPDNDRMVVCVNTEAAKHFGSQGRACGTVEVYAK
jgi:hypothetical protein